MVLHPHVQARAQADVDGIVGRDRLPTFDDCDALPYVQAVVREVLRWRPVLPLCAFLLLYVSSSLCPVETELGDD